MKTILIDSRDLSYTIDTYGTFTMDNGYDMEVEHLMDNDDTLTFDNFDDRYDVTYDMDGYRRHLAELSVNLLEDNLKGDVVKSITLDENGSPRFYNYTTDWYTAKWEFDEKELANYVTRHYAELAEWIKDTEWSTNPDYLDGDEDTVHVAMLDFYTSREYSEDDYVDYMYEGQQDWEYITFEPVKEVRQ